MEEIKDFKFCSNRKCKNVECRRHPSNTPYGIIITRSDEFKEEKGKCKGYLV